MRVLATFIAVIITAALIPLAARANSTTPPWQCSASVNLYDFSPSVAQACGDSVYPLDHVTARSDGGKDYVYFMKGQRVVIPSPPPGFTPASATDDQLSYYGFPARPLDPSALPEWRDSVAHIHTAPAPPFLIETKYRAPFSVTNAGGSGGAEATLCSPINLCWGGYVNTGTTFTQSYIDYTEPGEAQTSCSGDAVVAWTGLGGYDGGLLGQDGTAPYVGGMPAHEAWWEAWPENNITQLNFAANRGDDIQAHVSWQSSYYRFKFTVWDTTIGQQQTAYYTPQTHPFDGNSSEFIIERPQDQTTIYPLRNFWTGWSVIAAQSNNIGMQNFPLSRYNIQNKAGTTLETTSGNNGQSFSATWDACG